MKFTANIKLSESYVKSLARELFADDFETHRIRDDEYAITKFSENSPIFGNDLTFYLNPNQLRYSICYHADPDNDRFFIFDAVYTIEDGEVIMKEWYGKTKYDVTPARIESEILREKIQKDVNEAIVKNINNNQDVWL